MVGTCYICQQSFSTIHVHHTSLQSYGGKDSLTVKLCPTHHNLIHLLATKGNRDYSWETDEQRSRGQPLVDCAIKSMTSDTHVYKIWYTVDAEKRRNIERLKKELGQSSIEKTVDFCVTSVMKKLGII